MANGLKKVKDTEKIMSARGDTTSGIDRFAQDLFPNDATKKSTPKGNARGINRQGTGSFIESAIESMQETKKAQDILAPLTQSNIGPKRNGGSVFEQPVPSDITKRNVLNEVNRAFAAKGISPERATGLIKRMQTPSLDDISKLKPGESIGNFSIATTPRGSKLGTGGEFTPEGGRFGVRRTGGKPSIFSQKGIENFFQELANPEFRKQIATQRSASATRKGQRADAKALNERIKTIDSVIKGEREAGASEEDLAPLLRQRETFLQKAGGGVVGIEDQRIQIFNQLADVLPRETLDIIGKQLFNEGK